MGQRFTEACARVQIQESAALPHPLDAASIEEITEAFSSSVRGIYGSNVWTPQSARNAFEVGGLNDMAKTDQSAWR